MKSKKVWKVNPNVKCKCSHSIGFFDRNPYKICNYCGRINFIDKKEELKYRLKHSKGVKVIDKK